MRSSGAATLSAVLHGGGRAHRGLLEAGFGMTGEPLLRVEHLRKYYPVTKGVFLHERSAR